MPSVHLDFNPPRDDGFVTLKIWESPTDTGPWTNIETVTDVGVYPNYLSDYTTDQAIDPKNNWYAIEWIDSKGASTDLSNPIQGGAEKLIGEIVNRMALYDPNLSENIAYFEAEATIEEMYNADPYTISVVGVKYRRIQGLVYYALARAYIATLIVQEASGASDDYTAGLISQKSGGSSGTQTRIDFLKYLIQQANLALGKNYTVVALMKKVEIAGGLSTIVDDDQSRLLIEVE